MRRIIVDADSMPVRVRELICRAAGRGAALAVFVANQRIPGIAGPGTELQIAEDADEVIVAGAADADLVVTRDIPLAERLVDRGVVVLNDRGDVFTAENVAERRSLRDAAQRIRAMGLEQMGHRRFGPKEAQQFANALDRELAKLEGDTANR